MGPLFSSEVLVGIVRLFFTELQDEFPKVLESTQKMQ